MVLLRRLIASIALVSFSLIPLSSTFLWFTKHVEASETVEEVKEKEDIMKTMIANLGRKTLAIDLSAQRARAIENGVLVSEYKISSGARTTPTPVGRFQVHRKQPLRVSNLDLPYRMPYYMAFTSSESHGIHALPYLGRSAGSSGYWHEARSHIGIPVSHGCIRLLPEDAEKLYEWVEEGIPVLINI